MKAPLLFIIFNRPNETARVFDAIRAARPERLYIAADGPRTGRTDDITDCAMTREVVSRVDWPCEVKTLFRDTNLGCKKAVSSAIDWYFRAEEEGIILEDDCLPDPSFFPFCEELLARYRTEKRVYMITGDNFQNGMQHGGASYYFSTIPHIWGWATWRRAWQTYDADMASFPSFRADGSASRIWKRPAWANYWLESFANVFKGKVDTWDIQWSYAVAVNGGLVATPNINLITNIGYGPEATHTKNERSSVAGLPRSGVAFPLEHPRYMKADVQADAFVYKNIFGVDTGLRQRISGMVRRAFPRVHRKLKSLAGK